MQSLKIVCAVALAALSTSACMVENSTESLDSSAQQSMGSENVSANNHLQIPDELKLQRPESSCGGTQINFFQGVGNGCAIRGICHDASRNCVPTFCVVSGNCHGTAAIVAAQACRDACNSCNPANLVQLQAGTC
jgi:hypothetical protein